MPSGHTSSWAIDVSRLTMPPRQHVHVPVLAAFSLSECFGRIVFWFLFHRVLDLESASKRISRGYVSIVTSSSPSHFSKSRPAVQYDPTSLLATHNLISHSRCFGVRLCGVGLKVVTCASRPIGIVSAGFEISAPFARVDFVGITSSSCEYCVFDLFPNFLACRQAV